MWPQTLPLLSPSSRWGEAGGQYYKSGKFSKRESDLIIAKIKEYADSQNITVEVSCHATHTQEECVLEGVPHHHPFARWGGWGWADRHVPCPSPFRML